MERTSEFCRVDTENAEEKEKDSKEVVSARLFKMLRLDAQQFSYINLEINSQLSLQLKVQVSIHSLPTELLVIIFSRLTVRDLSWSVARVCRRWREALQCKALWQEKELIYQVGKEGIFVFVLRVASSLKKVTITPLACEHPDRVISAILNGPKDVKEFHYNLSLFPVDTGARILRHYKDHVKELHLEGDAERQSGLQRNLSPLLGQMSQLHTLKLSGYFDTKWNEIVLKEGCANIQHLDVSHIQDECDSYLPLLDSVKTHLKTLRLPQFKSNVGVLALVACCTELTEVTLCLDDLRCIGNLHQLQSLHIRWTDESSRCRVSPFIRECPVFQNLKELTLHYIPGPIASAIAKQCHRLESLTMHGIMSCSDIIKSVPTLQRLCVVDRLALRLCVVQKLPRYLPNLKYVDVRGCFMQRGIPPKIIQQVKRDLPGLCVVSDKFIRYTKHGSMGYIKRSNESSTDCSSDDGEEP